MIEINEALKELGRIVTERRESAGMTLETVFDRTRIRPEFLRGIEEGDYTDFPEPVYIKGFIRTYLKLINAEDMLEDFYTQLERSDKSKSQIKQETASRNVANVLSNGSSMSEGFKPVSHFWLFLVLIAALAGTGIYVWYAVNNGGLDLKNLKFFNFDGAGGIVNSENSSSELEVNVTEVEDVTISDDANISEAEEEPEPEPEIKPSLEIHALNDVWLSVAFGNAQPAYRRTLKRGEVMRWDLGSEPARVVFGRPTAAQVVLNGQDLGVVNAKGKKAETYIFNADGTYKKVK